MIVMCVSNTLVLSVSNFTIHFRLFWFVFPLFFSHYSYVHSSRLLCKRHWHTHMLFTLLCHKILFSLNFPCKYFLFSLLYFGRQISCCFYKVGIFLFLYIIELVWWCERLGIFTYFRNLKRVRIYQRYLCSTFTINT